jgi:hypothetical protein
MYCDFGEINMNCENLFEHVGYIYNVNAIDLLLENDFKLTLLKHCEEKCLKTDVKVE